ncbi:MAG TPA: sigma 54-interacting transcriptional regulator [Myxococcaceae bacterium]|jgi:DNA-binding NtrC family response regulator
MSELTALELVAYQRDGTKVAELRRGAALVVGRASPSDVVVPDPSLSRQHARFSWTADGLVVEDLGSTNGTKVRGEKVQQAKISPGDLVELGPAVICLHAKVPGQALRRELISNDRLMMLLEQELARARTFQRPLALAVVRARGKERAHVSKWEWRVQAMLRPVDQACLYGPGAMLLLLPELGGTEAAERLKALEGGEPALGMGLAIYPDQGLNAHELVENARGTPAPAAAGPGEDRRLGVGGRPPTDTLDSTALSPAMREIFATVRRVAGAAAPVLILGETGVGKELVARALHQRGPRHGQPFKAINCAAMPSSLLESLLFGHEKGAFTGADRAQRGLFEQASGGTVFLDEIGELAPPAQAALLRVLETKRLTRIGSDEEVAVDVRVVAATHRDLEAMTAAGTFRMDLLYRLNTVTLRIPPLRARTVEIPVLADLFLQEAGRVTGVTVTGVSPAAMELLKAYHWPGNVRELRNVVERAVMIAHGSQIQPEDLPEHIRDYEEASIPPPGAAPASSAREKNPFDARSARTYAELQDKLKDWTQEKERELLLDALQRHGGNQTEAARALQMPLRTLVHKIRALGLKKKYESE